VSLFGEKNQTEIIQTDARGAKEEQEEEKAGATSVGGVERETEIC